MSEELAPGTQIVNAITSAPVGLAEQEVIEILIEQTRFAEEPEQKRTAIKLLESGHTLVSAAQRMGVRASTLFRWAKEPDVSSALSSGREYRRQVLGGRLELAADQALTSLVDVATDPDISPRDRVKASEILLDRCGITPETAKTTGQMAQSVTIDVDFDERLARIVASGSSNGLE